MAMLFASFKLKACKRCQGDMYFDAYEHEYVCIQCGARS